MDKEIKDYYEYVKSLKRLSIGELRKLYENDDVSSKKKFLEAYLYYIFANACNVYKYLSQKIDIKYPLMDFIQDSNLYAVELIFNSKYKIKEFTFFRLYLYRGMFYLLEKNILVKSKGFRLKEIIALQEFCDNYLKENRKEITLDELEKLTNVKYYRLVNFFIDDSISIDELDDEILSNIIGYDTFEDELVESLLPCNINKVVQECLSCLNERNKEIIERLYGLNNRKQDSQTQIACDMGCSRQEIFASKDRSIRKMFKEKGYLIEEYRKNKINS